MGLFGKVLGTEVTKHVEAEVGRFLDSLEWDQTLDAKVDSLLKSLSAYADEKELNKGQREQLRNVLSDRIEKVFVYFGESMGKQVRKRVEEKILW